MKRYLQEKQKIREKTGLKSSEKLESVAEMIGESSSTNKLPKGSQASTLISALFKNKSVDKDPLSLIAVYAKKNGQILIPKEKRTRRRQKDASKSKSQISESIIEDYPEDFEESVPKTGSTIEEDLPQSTSSLKPDKVKPVTTTKGLVPAVGAVNQTTKLKDKQLAKRPVKESPVDSIVDEVIDEVGSIEDEILEESGLKNNASIIKDEYEQDNSKIAEAKQKIEARNRLRFGLASA